jgi:hypothetical protein
MRSMVPPPGSPSLNVFTCSDCGWVFTRPWRSLVMDYLDGRAAEVEFDRHDCAIFPQQEASIKGGAVFLV